MLYKYSLATNTEQVRLELQYEESRDILSHIIKLSVNGEEFPKNYFLNNSTTSVTNILLAYTHITTYYHTIIQDDLNSALAEIHYFLSKVEIVMIETEELGNALKIFETINQRGAGLNAMDLTKNLLFINSDSTEFGQIKEIWKKNSEVLKECKEDDKPMRFMRYFFMARYTSDVITEDRIYRWLTSADGVKSVGYDSTPIDFAKELLVLAKRYARLVSATDKYDVNLPSVYNIGLINKTSTRQHLILLLALHQDVSDSVLEFLAKQLENYFFYTVCLKIQAKTHEKFFARVAQKLRGKKTIEEVKPIIEDTLGRFVAEKIGDFKQIFPTIKTHLFKPDYRLRYVFGKMDMYISRLCGLPCPNNIASYSQYQIEHILPQTPKDDFLGEWMDAVEYKKDLDSLGNVTLLEGLINKAVNKFNDLSSDWFNKKQREYYNSVLPITRLLSSNYLIGNNTALNRYRQSSGYEFDRWDKQSIVKRQQLLCQLALQIWKFDSFKNIANVEVVEYINRETQSIVNTTESKYTVDNRNFDLPVLHSVKTVLKKSAGKSPRTNIRIIFPNGHIIQNPIAADTMVEFVKYVGVEKVRRLGLIQCKIPLVSNTLDEKYANKQKEVAEGWGWYVMTNTSTNTKIADIMKISDAYTLNVRVEKF